MFLHPRCCWSCPAKLNTAHRLWEQVVASQIAGSQDGGGCFSCSSSWQRKARFNTISSFPLSKRNVLPDTRAWRHALPCSKALSETERSPKLQTAIQNLPPFISVLSQSILACRMGGPFQLAQERVCECVCVCVCVNYFPACGHGPSAHLLLSPSWKGLPWPPHMVMSISPSYTPSDDPVSSFHFFYHCNVSNVVSPPPHTTHVLKLNSHSDVT